MIEDLKLFLAFVSDDAYQNALLYVVLRASR